MPKPTKLTSEYLRSLDDDQVEELLRQKIAAAKAPRGEVTALKEVNTVAAESNRRMRAKNREAQKLFDKGSVNEALGMLGIKGGRNS